MMVHETQHCRASVLAMLAVLATSCNDADPLQGLEIRDFPDPEPPEGWVTVEVRAAALNHHDIWTLRGVGVDQSQLPMVLGCDAAGVTEDGQEVVVHALIADPDRGRGDETLDPKRSILSERYHGTLAEKVAVPRRNLVPKPPSLSFEEAACLPTAWLTAYRMLSLANLRAGDTVLIQGAGGGVSTAAILLASHAGYRVWVTSREEAKRSAALRLGAHEAFETGQRLPQQVDAVLETVGEATWGHSLRALRPGGTIVVVGATTGDAPSAELRRVFFRGVTIKGSTMGTIQELQSLVSFLDLTGVRPPIDTDVPLSAAREAFQRLLDGEMFGKIVLRP